MSSRTTSEERSIWRHVESRAPHSSRRRSISDTFFVKPSTGAVYDHVPEKRADIGGELFSAALDVEAEGAGAEAAMLAAALSHRFAINAYAQSAHPKFIDHNDSSSD
ncbi:hypothetical protein Smed_3648 (plasmid) [Sinorhizobium medicae WSM419]|uniref:Uncharacterized protein n=1 Tax=Sinorhizobium medicae (strain WSM419) TaxID=366394 RepID=A6UFN1_SINMW|nr:hypothetical protein Smed_3648 [Sinorhizobium medicae WSM419]